MLYTGPKLAGQHVVVFDGATYPVRARTGAIIKWLLDRAPDIDEATGLQITFDCAGRSVVPEAREQWPANRIKLACSPTE